MAIEAMNGLVNIISLRRQEKKKQD